MFTKSLFRAFTSIIIWALCTGIAITAIDDSNTWAVIVALGAAMMSTLFIWSEDSDDRQASDEKTANVGKAKRGGDPQAEKMRLLMELMDDDERQAFKETLKAQLLRDSRHLVDGELPYDAELFDAKEFDAPEKRLRGE